MSIKFFTLSIALSLSLYASPQTSALRINPNIVLPKDSAEGQALISAINQFLLAAQKPNEQNKLVLENQKLETFILLEEIKGIEKSGKYKNENFYKPYLTNIVLLKGNKYSIQVSYIGINNDTALLRMSFEIIAHKTNNSFSFSSTLIANTKTWENKRMGNNVFHYQNIINSRKVKEFTKMATDFDKKLTAIDNITEFYCCANIKELQKILGIEYKSDYNGRTESILSAAFEKRKIIVLGDNNADFNHFDKHDLWHDRLSLVIDRSKVNKPVDEGCAYLYGGSWGLTWQEIFKAFMEQVASNKNTDWAAVKENRLDFKTNGFNNSADNIVNALLVQKIEKEKGFAGVWELLTIGAVEKGNEKYYQVLEKLTGITRKNYNKNIFELINNEK